MVAKGDQHKACVTAWLERAAQGLPARGLLDLLERAFEALWARLRPTLGDATLGAVAERVVHDAAVRFSPFSSIEVAATGLRFAGLRAQAFGLHTGELAAAIHAILTDFLTVLGHLTAEVLTPAMHATLSAVAREGLAPPTGARRGGHKPGPKQRRKHEPS